MNATIDIIGLNGRLKHSAVFEEGSVRKFELMKEDYVRLIFSTNIHFAIGLGDHITLEDWGTFEITEPQQPKYNSDTGGYDYDLQFNAPYYKWNNKLFKFEPATKRNEASWSLTDTLRNHMAVFLRNLAFYGWNYTLDIPASLETAAKHIFIQYDNSYMLDALTKIAEAFECEWWVTDNIIHFGKCESGTAIDFELGVNVEDMGAKDTNKDYITRLYAFGSNRNIPANYRKSDEQALLNGVVQKRLMLPATTPFVDIEGVSQTEEIVEGIVIFDDVFPQTNNAITDVSEDVRTVEKTETTVEAAGNTDTITETDDEEAETENVTIYRFKDSRLVFSESYLLPGVQLQVQFQSGSLNGMIFDLAFNPDAESETIVNDGTEETNPNAQWFEIIRNETYGLMLPNETLRPATGDSFVLIGWDITKMESGFNLITQAEEELLERTEAYADKLQIDPNTYPCKMMSDYMYGLDRGGNQDSNFSKVGTFPIGQRVRLNNATFFKSGSRLSRVVGYEYKLDKPYDEAIIYVGESATYSTKERTASAVNQVNSGSSINYRGSEYSQVGGGGSSVYIITSNDTTAPADSNVFSALRTERQYARKDRDDSISSLWTFNHGYGKRRGIQTKHYNENGANEDNLFGKGFELVERVNSNGDNRTRLEVDELFVRIKAFFAQLEIREISYVGGNYVFSAAGSKIYYVEWIDANNHLLPKAVGNIDSIYKFRCYLYSDNGTTATINKWAVNDQAMCQIFNIDEGVHQGATNKYYWRRVLGIGKGVIQSADDDTEYQYVDISKSDCATNSDYPEAEDTIVQLGNWTNSARQGVIYLIAEGESAPAIMEYSGVGANGRHFVLPDPTLLLSPKKNVIYGEFHSVTDGGGNTGSGNTIEDQLRALLDQLNDIKNQADKKFDIWFGSGIPLPSKDNQSAQANYPASEWTTEALKALHAQDLFYDTTREPAADGGRAWRWIAAAGENDTVTYYWDEVTDADTLAALEQISDVASDGVLTGGAEKTRVLVDWNKAEYEYWKYTEQARDYGLDNAAYYGENEENVYTAYVQAFLALGKYLNGGSDLTLNANGTYNTPSWLAGNNLLESTDIVSPIQYRTVWNNYYSALASLLKAITKRAKELADQAQADATQALNAIEKIASDGWLMPDEKIEIRREFVAAYHEMNDDGGLLDKAIDDRGSYDYINYNRHVKPYVDAFNALGTYLNGGTSWISPATDPNDNTAWILPLWIDDSHMNAGVAINGETFCALWATFYSTRTMVLTKLSENAQQTATGAHERVDDIVSDGVISAGSEKSLLYIDWLKTIAEYGKYIEQAADYFGETNTQDDALVMAYKKLATMLNNGNPSTQYDNVSESILNGTTRPLWLDADHINADTVLSDTPIQTADAYRTIWNNYYVALTSLLEVITSKAKELADQAQADASEALASIGAMGDDNKLDASEKLTVKREFLASWHERDDEGGILDRCKAGNQYINDTIEDAYVTPYRNAFIAVGSYLNGRSNNQPVTWVGLTITSSTTDAQIENAMPLWLKNANMDDTNTIDGDAWRKVWSTFYSARTALLTALSEDAKDRADEAQQTADNIQDEIDRITSDGILSRIEKKEVRKEWDSIVRVRVQNLAIANAFDLASYTEYGTSGGQGLITAYNTAFTNLGKYLNGDLEQGASSSWNGTSIPAWLDDFGTDQPIVPATYRSKWEAYYEAESAMLNAIASLAKKSGDDALAKLNEIAADGKVTPSEKDTLLVNWREVVSEFPVLINQADDYLDKASDNTEADILQAAMDDYTNKFESLALVLNDWVAYSYSIVANDFPLPTWLGRMGTTEELTTSQIAAFNTAWDEYFKKRTILQEAITDAARRPGDDALDELEDLAADGILTPIEKITVLREWEKVTAEYNTLTAQAAKAHVSTQSFTTAYGYLGQYLHDPAGQSIWGIGITPNTLKSPLLYQNTTIDPATYKQRWTNYYNARSALLTAISNAKVGYFVSVSVPAPPYYEGDLWMKLADANDTIGTMMVCTNTRESGSGQLSDWSEVRETTRDPRILLAALAEKVYEYVGGYIKEKAKDAYLALYFTTSTNSAHADGDLRFDGTVAYHYSDTWEEISNDSLTTAFRAVWDLFGNGKTIKVYSQKPSGASEHDLVCSSITFTDPYLENGNQYQTVEGGIEILMYGKNGWEVLRESTRSIIENLRGYIRMVAFGSANGTIQSSGIVTRQNFAEIFSQAVGEDGTIITASNIGTYIDDFVDETGVRQIISGVTISADQIDITGNDRISLMVKNAVKYNVGANLITSSLICETSTAYGFAKRYVKLEQGQKYTFSANGLVPYNAYQNGMELRVYIWRMDNGSWANSQLIKITYNAGNAMTKSVTFTADAMADYLIQSYMALASGSDASESAGGTRTYGVTVNWYKLEKGETATEWIAGVGDEMLWKNYITNPRAVDGTFDSYTESGVAKSHCSKVTDATFGEVVRIIHDTNSDWQLRFTAGNGYESLVGKVVTFFCICKKGSDQDATAKLCFGGGDENVSALNTAVSDFIDLGNGWRKYYATRYIQTGLMSNSSGQNTNTIGINCVIGTWDVYAVGVVLGGVCPTTQEIMEHCGLKATGIDIENNRITLYGNNIVFGNSDGSITGKIWIDPTAGTLHAANANISGVFTSEDVEMGNSIIIDAEAGSIKMRGPISVQDGTYLPNGSSRGDMLDIHFETDPDSLSRLATLKLSYANGYRHILLDPQNGISMYDRNHTDTQSLDYLKLESINRFFNGMSGLGSQKSSSFSQGGGFFVIMDSNLTLPNFTDSPQQYMLIFNTASRTLTKGSNTTLYVDGTAQNSVSVSKNAIGILNAYVDNYGNNVWDFYYVS